MPATKKIVHHNPHTTQKIGEMIIVVIVLLLLCAVAIFLTEQYQTSLPSNNTSTSAQIQSVLDAAAAQQFQQITAPPGTAVIGFPADLVPVHGQITSSYHNQYNGYDQYTLNLTVNSSMANEYAALQTFLTKAKFKVTQKSTSKTTDMINAGQGSDYVTVQLTAIDSATTNVSINYGQPIK